MSHFVVDVESDGQVPGIYSMISFGIIKVTPQLNETFFGQVKPISELYDKEAAAVNGIDRETHLTYPEPLEVMPKAVEWIKRVNGKGRPIFWSDNNGYDWSFMNYYFHAYAGENPFGWSSRRIGDLFCGLNKNLYFSWKKYRKTKHSHHPVDDAKANAEALLKIQEFGIKL